jgi:predicted acylesterase/phospholipase RssA
MKKITKLVISGGGNKGFAMLGSLQYLFENNILDNIEEYWGTSIGSVLSLLLNIGYEPFDIFFELNKSDTIFNISEITINKFVSGIGLCPIHMFGMRVMKFFHMRYPDIHTFTELFNKTGKKLFVIGTNVNTLSQEIFSVENTPDMKLIDAIEISCNLPFIFTRKIFNDIVYVDGGFTNNYPIDLADKGNDLVLGIYIKGIYDKEISNEDISFINWMTRLWAIPIVQLQSVKVNHTSPLVINLPLVLNSSNEFDFASLNMKQRDKLHMYRSGYIQTEKFSKTNYFLSTYIEE